MSAELYPEQPVVLETEGVVHALPTDESLEWHYGHLSTEELAVLPIPRAHKTRLAQLQIAAMHIITHSVDEACEWIEFYHYAGDKTPHDDTYI